MADDDEDLNDPWGLYWPAQGALGSAALLMALAGGPVPAEPPRPQHADIQAHSHGLVWQRARALRPAILAGMAAAAAHVPCRALALDIAVLAALHPDTGLGGHHAHAAAATGRTQAATLAGLARADAALASSAAAMDAYAAAASAARRAL